jgi:hypothetical protein
MVPPETAPQPKLISLDEANTMLAAEARPKTFEETHKPVKQKPGLVFAKKKPHKGSTLTIKTKPGTNYYVQLNTAGTKTAMQGIYVIGGKPVTVDVPIGVYDIVYATGDTWYGRQDKFGPSAPLYKTDHTFDYRLEADGSIPYYEIELIQQVGGNMETERIDPAEFGE